MCKDVSEEYKRLHKHFGILRSAGLPFRMLKGKREDVVHALLAGGHFALAREFVSDVRRVLLPLCGWVSCTHSTCIPLDAHRHVIMLE